MILRKNYRICLGKKATSSLWKTRNSLQTVFDISMYVHQQKIFRETTSSLEETLLSRNFCQKFVRVNLHHSVKLIVQKKTRQSVLKKKEIIEFTENS